MTESSKIYKDLGAILDELVSSSNELELARHPQNVHGELRIWTCRIQLPKNEFDTYHLLLPNENSTIDEQFLAQFAGEKVYIIDCFRKYTGARVSDPRNFFLKFLFDTRAYNKFFKENSVFRDIEKLYIDRTASFFNDKDSLANQNVSSLECLLEQWQESGNRPLLLLGDRGIGKSWTVLKHCQVNYALHLNDPWSNPIPIYINLRGLSENIPGVTNLGELIFYHLVNHYGIRIFGGYFTFTILLNSGRIILVLDGLDEMSKEVSRELTIKNIWQVFGIFSNSSKFILTSRINFFSSRAQIREHFAYQSFRDSNVGNPLFKNEIYNHEERRVRQDFNIWEIAPLQSAEKAKLFEKARKLNDQQLVTGLDKLIRFSSIEEPSIQFELALLSNIPAYFLPVVSFLSANQSIPLVDIYEQCINRVIIEFNIETDRAIDEYETITNTKEKNIEHHVFKAEQKNKILRKLAWYMIEREIDDFDLIEFPKYIKEIEGIDFEIVLNDLQTQTVITLKEEGKYSFTTNGIFSFYVANYFYYLLTDDNPSHRLKGIQDLGKYDFSGGDIIRRTNLFLNEKIGALLRRDPNGKEKEKEKEKVDRIIELAHSSFEADRPYSPWLKHLSSNLRMIGLDVASNNLRRRDFWNIKPISNQGNRTDRKMVLIPGRQENRIKPFFLGITEVTNREYLEFLHSVEFEGDEKLEDCLGSYWQRKEAFGNVNNPYLDIINYYHIISWTNGKIPKGKNDHPVVWISWFAAAKFCNWLSRREGFDLYYKFIIENNKFVRLIVNKMSAGYRLPTEREWRFAASGGNLEAETIFEIYDDDIKEQERIRAKLFEEEIETTSSVKSENPNKFGVYGMMGNVREWVDKEEVLELHRFGEQMIKGMGWLLGQEGFKFDHSTSLIAQNNNVDVGFRIARSLRADEDKKVSEAYLGDLKSTDFNN